MITGKSPRKLLLLLVILSSTLQFQSAYAQGWNDDPRSTRQIAKKKGKVVATETLDWHTNPKDIPKDWKKLKNSYFSASYPPCFTLEGQGGDDDVKTSPAVLFSRSSSCEKYNKELGEYNWLGIEYSPGNPLRAASEAGDRDELFVQNLKINGIAAKMIVNVMDSNHGGETKPQLRWQIFLLCGKKTMRIDIDYGRGKPTLDLIEKGDYTFPEDFKLIVSTFKCR